MKATEIVRRIEDLGRVVIPKEIGRTFKIRKGGLGYRLGRRFYFVEVSTGHPRSVLYNIVILGEIYIEIHSVVNEYSG